MYELLPFWHTFFTKLGFPVHGQPRSPAASCTRRARPPSPAIPPASRQSSATAISTGWPQGVDAVFYPCMSYNLDEHLGDNHYNCPVVAYYPEVLAGNCPELDQIQFIYDYVNLDRRKDFTSATGILTSISPASLKRKCTPPSTPPTRSTSATWQQVRARAPRSLTSARRKAATSSCWPAAPTMWTRRSTMASTS